MPRAVRVKTDGFVRPGELAHVVLCLAAALPIALVLGTGISALSLASAPLAAALPPVLSFLVLAALASLSLASFVRPVEIAVARTLLGVDLPDAIAGPTIASRMLGMAWFIVCGMVGFVVGVALFAVLPLATALIFGPVPGSSDALMTVAPPFAIAGGAWAIAASLFGVALVVLVVLTVLAAGRGLTSLAPIFLGATDADRRVLEERRAVESARANTIARELHDSVGHALTAIVVQAGAARVQSPEASAETLETIEDLARHALGELDGALGALRRGADRDAHSQRGERGRRSGTVDSRGDGPATATLETVLSTAHRVLELDARVDSLDGLADDVQSACVRIVQESLTNAVRHGDGAALVRIERSPNHVRLHIRNRVGTPEARQTREPLRGGRGVPGMRERVVLLGGSLEAGPTPDGSWVVDARIPIRQPHPTDHNVRIPS